jgi:hypothetical protein
VTLQDAVIVVDTLNVPVAYAPVETATKRAAPAASAVPVRVSFVKSMEMFKLSASSE